MRNIKKNRALTEKRQAWIETIGEKTNLSQVLTCFLPRGLATQDHVEKLTGLTTKQVRGALDDLVKGFFGNVPLLRSESVHLQGRRGRPQVVYLLTIDGAAVLNRIQTDEVVSPSQVEDQIELAHGLMEMEIYLLAKQAGLNPAIERPIRFGEKHSIRADVLIQPPNGDKVIIEMEQAARPGDVTRILGKLKQYEQFFSAPESKGICKEIRVLFNLAPSDTMSIKRWSMILAELCGQEEPIPYRLLWQPVLEFLQNPQWDGLEGFVEIEPDKPTPTSQETASEPTTSLSLTSEKDNRITVGDPLLPPMLQSFKSPDLTSLNLILRALAAQNEVQHGSLVYPDQSRGDFFELVRTIYQVSHFHDGPVQRYAALPILSLVLLYRYLNLHQNKVLLEMVLKARDDVRRGQNRGINLFRDAFTRLCWDFMRYHGIGRGGPVEIYVRVPTLDSDVSEINVEVRITNQDLIVGSDGLMVSGDLEMTEKSLAWVLGALWVYGEELGLSTRTVKKGKNGAA
jgi:hypothetical protein